ncbi:MAG: lyase [Pseudomonadota bacterium]
MTLKKLQTPSFTRPAVHAAFLAAFLAAAFVAPGPTGAADLTGDAALDIKEWTVPYDASRPRDPFAVDGAVWFVGQRTGYVARLDLADGAFTKIDLPNGERPHNLIVGTDGIVWYAGNSTGVIGRFDPTTQAIEEIAMPDAAASDPHTLVFDATEENIWFSVQGGNMMGRMNVASRKVDLIAAQSEGARPYGIKVAPDGAVWVALFGVDKLGRIDPQTLELTEIDLPRADARPRRLEVGADGRVWYVDYAGGFLGAYDPATQGFKEWPMPAGADARPYGTAMDADGDVWFVETGVQPNMFRGFDPDTETFFAGAPVPSGGGTLRHMHYHAPTGAVWFGADANTIGRASVDAVPSPSQ